MNPRCVSKCCSSFDRSSCRIAHKLRLMACKYDNAMNPRCVSKCCPSKQKLVRLNREFLFSTSSGQGQSGLISVQTAVWLLRAQLSSKSTQVIQADHHTCLWNRLLNFEIGFSIQIGSFDIAETFGLRTRE